MACNCILCQVEKKTPQEQYAYHYAIFNTAKYVLRELKEYGVEVFDYDPENRLNKLVGVMTSLMQASGYLENLEKQYPELKNWFKQKDDY